jgi:hypothetical protein
MGTTANLICYLLKSFADLDLFFGRTGTSTKRLTPLLELLGSLEVTRSHNSPWCFIISRDRERLKGITNQHPYR